LRDDDPSRQGAANVAFKSAELILRSLRDYHRHEAVGVENIPREGGFVLACNHSFATYDGFLMAVILKDDLGRIPIAIGDRLMLRSRIFGPFFRELGFIEGSRESAAESLKAGQILGLLPGGMREALRSSKDKYRIDWRGRFGFVWASLLSGTPIVLAACPRADDIFDVADLSITRRVYERFKVPMALVRGYGPSVIPRPIQLIHLVSEPIEPPVAPDQVTERDVVAHHATVTERMNELMKEALTLT
jgi:hypothetical protein